MTNDQGHVIDDQIMIIAVPAQTRQKLGSEVLGAVKAQVIVGLGVTGGNIRPRPAEEIRREVEARTVVGTVRLVGTNTDRGGPKVAIGAVCEGTTILMIALPSIRTAEAVEPKVTFCVDAVRSGEPKIIGIDGPGVFR